MSPTQTIYHSEAELLLPDTQGAASCNTILLSMRGCYATSRSCHIQIMRPPSF